MGKIGKALSDIVGNIVAGIVMLIFAVLSFFLLVFVINSGSALAGLVPDANFVVLAAALVTSAAIIAGIQY